MKAYLFDEKTGMYEGETFEEAVMLQYEGELTSVPPPDYEQGQVPGFDRQKNTLTVIPVSIARQLLKVSPSSPEESSQ